MFCYFLAAALLLTSLQVVAQTYVPKYSNEFLSVGVSARGQAMGGAMTAISNDVTSGYWNPAGLSLIPNPRKSELSKGILSSGLHSDLPDSISNKYQFSLMHASFFAGVANYDYAGFATAPDTNSVLAINFIRFGVDDIADTRFLIVADNIDYSRIRRFSASDNALLLSYSRKNIWLRGLNFGGTFKIIYRNAGNFANAWGFGLDAGLQYRRKRLLLGLMARDVTSTFNAWSYNTAELSSIFSRTNNSIPSSSTEITLPKWVLGIGYNIITTQHIGLLAALDLNATFDGKRNVPISGSFMSIDPSLGLEASYNKVVYARFGINNIQKIKNFDGSEHSVFQPNFGLGLRLANRVNIDYALSNLGTTTESVYTNVFSLKADFW
ncbi:MAG: hypothetical protein V4543_18350 [Bacteroidota bacterium]